MRATFPRRDDGEAGARAIELRIHRGEAIHGDTRVTKTFNGLIDLHRDDLAKVGKTQGRPKIAGLAVGTLRSPEGVARRRSVQKHRLSQQRHNGRNPCCGLWPGKG